MATYDDILSELNAFAANLNSLSVGHVAADGRVHHLLTLTVHQEDNREVVLVEATPLGRERFGAALGIQVAGETFTRLRPEQTHPSHVARLLGLPDGQLAIQDLTGQPMPRISALMDAARMADGAVIGNLLLADTEAGLAVAAADKVTISPRTVLPEQEHNAIDMLQCGRLGQDRRDGIDCAIGFRHVGGRLQRVDIHTVPDDLPEQARHVAAERLLAQYALNVAMRDTGVPAPKMHLHYDHLSGMPVVAQERFGEHGVVCQRKADGNLEIRRSALLAGDMKLAAMDYKLREEIEPTPSIGKAVMSELLKLAVSGKGRMMPFVAAAISADRADASITDRSIVLTMNEYGHTKLRGLTALVPAHGAGQNAPIARATDDLYSRRVLDDLLAGAPDKEQMIRTVRRQAEIITKKMSAVMTGELLTRGYLHPETACRYRLEADQSAAITLTPPGYKQAFRQLGGAKIVDISARRRADSGLEP